MKCCCGKGGAAGAWVAVFVSMVVAMQTASQTQSPTETQEQWYAVEMMGKKAGWMVMREQRADDRITTTTELRLELLRGGQGTSVGLESQFVETPDGEPISMTSSMKLGAMPAETRYEWQGDEVLVKSTQGGQTATRTMQAPEGEWLTPAAAARKMEKMIEQERREFSIRSIDPTAGLQVVESNYEMVGETTVEVMGKTIPAVEWRMTQSMMPTVDMTVFTDHEGTPVRTETGMAGMRMVMLATEKELAQSDLQPGEIMANTLVRPSEAIASPRVTRRGVYTLSIEQGALPDLPETSVQRVDPLGEQRVRVTVDMGNPSPAEVTPEERRKYLGSSSMIDPQDSEIQAMAERALRGFRGTEAEKAEELRRFVHEHIDEKSLGVGFASASEVCRTGEGDCTEHGVLLAALLRAEGIPARVATGLIYVDAFVGQKDVFGYHMWTQALLEVNGQERWVDLDATLGPQTPMDATHIALSVSALSEGGVVNSLASQAPLMGQLEIDVEEVAR